MTILHAATARGDLEKVKSLLKSRDDVNARRHYDNATPLIVASGDRRASHEMLQLLLDNGADTSLITSDLHHNALHLAAQDGQLAKVQCLINHGMDVNHRNPHGYAPLIMACYSKSPEKHDVIKFLLDEGANPARTTSYNETPIKVLSSDFDTLRLFELDLVIKSLGWSPLMIATVWGSLADMKRAPHDLEIRDAVGRTAWHLAIETGDIAKTQYLYDLAIQMGEYDTHYPNVYYAIKHNHHEMLDWLISIGAEIELSNATYFETPLSRAAFVGASDCLEILLNARDYDQFDKNIALVEASTTDAIQTLLDEGAEIDFRNPEGYTALSNACEDGDLGRVVYLLKRGANPDLPEIGDSPLIRAVGGDYFDIVRALLDAGADANKQTNPDMWFALQYVRSEEMLQILLDAGADTSLSDAGGVTAHRDVKDERLVTMLEKASR